VVVYPEAVWYGFVKAEDVGEIVASHIVGGKPVDRMVLPDSCLNTATCPHKPRH
jgi:(2Fe-2S) ferredoxin